ncbi:MULTISPECIES: hypothetical protein [Cyanophyceae]|uniref:Uncharacterized protein n=1 Tax=Leptolyngbya subtilissima DQ-A4 TaxID=2933933 RepID=A0ABV0K3M2_9CYAN|nr:hypothetical protein [Nodosilinea sp. FACHB-141]MBD2111322.1 hypothetical protein [Nodosilinea sp. FACHB-141]
MASHLQAKPCDLCQAPATVRYRIQCAPGAIWVLACPHCQKTQSEQNPNYRYGGTWKARLKKG